MSIAKNAYVATEQTFHLARTDKAWIATLEDGRGMKFPAKMARKEVLDIISFFMPKG